MMRYYLLLGFCLLLGLLACQTERPPTAEPIAVVPTTTPSSTVTVTAVPPTMTATPIITPSPTQTATSTVEPTATPTQMPTIPPTAVAPLTAMGFLSNTESYGERQLTIVNQIGGSVTAVAIQGHLAYLGIGARLAIADITDPTQPRIIYWSAVLPSVIEQIALDADSAVVALGQAGLWVFDLSQPLSPQVIGQVQTANPAKHFVLQDNMAYVVNLSSRPLENQILSVVDLTDLSRPQEIGTLDLPVSATKLAWVNGYLYASLYPTHARYEDTLWVIDVTNPAQPELVTAVPELAGEDLSVLAQGKLLVAQRETLSIMDINQPSQPTFLWQSPSLTDYGNIDVFHVAGNIVWGIGTYGDLDGCGGQLYAWDISNLDEINRLGELSVECGIYDMVVVDEYIYLATADGLLIIDIKKTAKPAYIGQLPTAIPSIRKLVGDSFLYGIQGNSDILTLDTTNPIQPALEGVYQSPYIINDLAIDGTLVYVVTYWQGIKAFDFTNPTSPQQLTETDYDYDAEGNYNPVLDNGRIYTSLNNHLGIFDADSLEWLGGTWDPRSYGSYKAFTVQNDILWTWSPQLTAIDVSNPSELQILGSLEQESEYRLNPIIKGNFLYYFTPTSCPFAYCSIQDALHVIDITNPQQMFQVATLPIPVGVREMIVANDLIILTGGDVWMVDISNPIQPQFVGHFPTPGQAQSAAMSGEFIYVADGSGGLLVLQWAE